MTLFSMDQKPAELSKVVDYLTTAKEKVAPLMQELTFGILTKVGIVSSPSSLYWTLFDVCFQHTV